MLTHVTRPSPPVPSTTPTPAERPGAARCGASEAAQRHRRAQPAADVAGHVRASPEAQGGAHGGVLPGVRMAARWATGGVCAETPAAGLPPHTPLSFLPQEFIVKFRVQQALAALAHGQSATNQARAALACWLLSRYCCCAARGRAVADLLSAPPAPWCRCWCGSRHRTCWMHFRSIWCCEPTTVGCEVAAAPGLRLWQCYKLASWRKNWERRYLGGERRYLHVLGGAACTQQAVGACGTRGQMRRCASAGLGQHKGMWKDEGM